VDEGVVDFSLLTTVDRRALIGRATGSVISDQRTLEMRRAHALWPGEMTKQSASSPS
jgi:hypothetical protein